MIERETAGARRGRIASRVLGWKSAGLLGAAVAVGLGGAALQASCAATPTAVPVQSFQRPQSVDVICLQVLDANGNALIPPVPEPQAQCAPVPSNVNGAGLPYHLFALVTQTTLGAVALVDLTAGNVVDEDPNTPGINFLPVGALPSDIASTPDGWMSFVGSAAPNSPSIYALPSTVVLGDSQGTTPDGGVGVLPLLTQWPACALPQAPGNLVVSPVPVAAGGASGVAAGDAGDAGDAGGGGAGAAGKPYVLVAVLPGDSTHPAGIATFDPAPFFRGAGALLSREDAGIDPKGPSIAPGSLEPCPLIQHIDLTAPASETWSAGPAWQDGVNYVDGSAPPQIPTTGVACTATDAGAGTLFAGQALAPRAGPAVLDTGGAHPILYIADTQLPLIHAIDLFNPSAPVELAPYVATSVVEPSRVVSVGKIAISPTTHDYKRFLYAIDQAQGSIMVYDVTDPVNGPHVPLTRPHPELTPLQAIDRIAFSAPVAALSFAVHDWPLTQKVVSNNGGPSFQEPLIAAETGLVCNPNPLVDPTFGEQNNNGGFPADEGPFHGDDGAYYRTNAIAPEGVAIGPVRLRGVFAFATLSNGNVLAIDVDDWDAPCRRPDPMAAPGQTSGNSPPQLTSLTAALVEGPLSSIAPPEPSPTSSTDVDPYHAPLSYQTYDNGSPVTLEWYFPVSQPHRVRSQYELAINSTVGEHAPYLLAPPQLFNSGAPVSTQGDQGVSNPSLVPTDTRFVDPSLQGTSSSTANPGNRTTTSPGVGADGGSATDGGDAGIGDGGSDATVLIVPTTDIALGQSTPGSPPQVRFAWEDPLSQIDQDWYVTYEGPLSGFYDSSGNPLVVANVVDDPSGGQDYWTLSLQSSDAYYCRKGVEDLAIGKQRAAAVNAELVNDALPPIGAYDQRVVDYVQLTDGIRDSSDPYWNVENTCWTVAEGALDGGIIPDGGVSLPPDQRQNYCATVYGSSLDPSNPSLARDFPILEAYDDHLVLGRFGYPNGGVASGADAGVAAQSRFVVGADPTNPKFLALMQCCFANQVHFQVRSGGEWSAVGSSVGFLSHVVPSGADNRCSLACDSREALLNGRAPPVPRPATQSTSSATCPSPFVPSIDRDSPLALRNPMFSFLVWNGQDPSNVCADTPPVRDMQWRFSTRGSLVPLAINLGASTTNLSPQSMKFIDSLGQIAVIDGESQGLILLDLGTISEAHTPYF